MKPSIAELLERFAAERCSAILRTDDATVAKHAMEAAVAGGFRIIEFTLTTPDALALIREFYQPDLAMVCIGGHFTMDPAGAAYAVSRFIKPKQVIPIHYGTFPVLNRTPAEFKEALGTSPIEVLDVKPGQAVRF